jgi:TolB-like protein
MRRRHFLLFPLALLGAACTFKKRYGTQALPYEEYAKSPLIEMSYKAADALVAQAGASLDHSHPVIAATLVDLDNLEESSPLGRLIAEQVGARFSQRGFLVAELKARKKLRMKVEEGELMLSRELSDLAQQQAAQAVVVGTYTEGADRVFINLKLIQVESHLALGAVNYALPLDGNVRTLLARHPAAQ